MRKVSMRQAVTGLALVMSANSAAAHGIAGNRFFVGTLTMDDPAVADEAIVPNFSALNEQDREAIHSVAGSIGPLPVY